MFALLAFYTPLKRLLPDISQLEPELQNGVADVHADEPEEGALATFAIPFGPFIALSALEWLVFEPWLMGIFRQYIYFP